MAKRLGIVSVTVMVVLGAAWAVAAPGDEETIAAGRKTVEGFFVAFNQGDNDALQNYMNYPHIFLSRNGGARVSEERVDTPFDRMREGEGWHHSSIGSLEPLLTFEDKVHFKLVFSRHHEDGSVYRTVTGEWVVTQKDGHWGVQLRSY